MRETNWMRIRLLVGAATPPVYPSSPYWLGRWIAGFEIPTQLPDYYHDRTPDWLKTKVEYYTGQPVEAERSMPTLGLAVKDPICGWDWIKDHLNDPYETGFELIAYGVHHKMNIRDPKVIQAVVKAIKPTKSLKVAYA